MLTKFTSRLSYGNVVATLALFLALGGGAYAALKLPKNSVGSAQIKANAVDSSKVKNGSLLGLDFKAGQLPAGAQGQQGAQGLQGPKGDKGDKGDTGTVDTSNFYTKGQSDGRFLARESSGIVDVPTTGTTTLLTVGSFTFTATCADEGGGPPNDFRVQVFAQSTDLPAEFGRAADQLDVTATPTELVNSVSSAVMVRESTASILSSSTARNVLVTSGVYRGGTANCFAGVTTLP
jgi:hypothetical protein